MTTVYAFNIEAKNILKWHISDEIGYGMLAPSIAVLIFSTVPIKICHSYDNNVVKSHLINR